MRIVTCPSAFLLLPFALLLCSFALAQTGPAQEWKAADWREIKTPPTRRDAAQMYQFVSALEPLSDPTKWTGSTHDQSAKATVSQGEGREPGKKSLRINYEFTGPDRLEYVDIAGNVPLTEDIKALGLWMKGGEHPLPARVRIADVKGECFQFDFGVLRPQEWTLGIAAIEGGGHWGGDNNGKLDPPYHIISILFDKLGARFKAKGTLEIAELGVYRKIPERLQPHGIKVFLPKDREYLVYAPGEEVKLGVSVPKGEVSAQLVDPFGEKLWRRTLFFPVRPPSTADADILSLLNFTSDAPGAYDLQLRVAGKAGEDAGAPNDLDAPWADFRFAVIPPVGLMPEDSPFGVSTHFGQGWPLSIMPTIARAGIKIYRDEISWGAVEQKKNQLAIPPRDAAYIKEGAKLGLEPLIIADYANKLYDKGDFPTSPEARAGFARYAKFLASELKDNLRLLEVWNEWCGGCGMGHPGKAESYAPLFLEAAKAIREGNQKAVVCGIGGEWGGSELTKMMGGGSGAQMDCFSIHPYHYPGLAGSWLRDHLKDSKDKAKAATGKPVPLWITEIGWPTNMAANGSSFLHQARCLVRMMVTALTSGAEKIVWYDFKDDGQDLAYNEHNFGLVHNEGYALAPKPAYVAYAHLTGLLSGRKLAAQEITPEGLWRTVYEGKGARVTILWMAEEGKTSFVRMSRGAKAEDLFGRPKVTTDRLEVTWDPVFVTERAG